VNFSIRPAQSEDAAIIAGFQIAMARETENKELDAATVSAGVQNAFENPANGFYLVAIDEKAEVVASLLVTFEWSDWRNSVFWWIQSVYVVPESRGKGIFRALYADVKSRAQNDANICGLRLYVERDNAKAQGVYQRLGMHEAPYRIYEEEWVK